MAMPKKERADWASPRSVLDVRDLRRRLNEMGVTTVSGERFPEPTYCKLRVEGPANGAIGCPTCHYVEDGANKFRPCPPREN